MELHFQIDAYISRLLRESTPEHTVWNVEKLREGKPSTWNYIDGCMITALLAMHEITGEARFFDFAEHYIGDFVREDGSIRSYEPEKFNLDDVNEGRVLFTLYEKTGKEKMWCLLLNPYDNWSSRAPLRATSGTRRSTPTRSGWTGSTWPSPSAPSMKRASARATVPTFCGRSKRSAPGCMTGKRSSTTTAMTPHARCSGQTRPRDARRTSG